MTYPCGYQHCIKDVTTRVRLRAGGGLFRYADFCDEHAKEFGAAILEVAPDTITSCGGYIKVNERSVP